MPARTYNLTSYEELEHFKSAINLIEFAASRGYVSDPRESSRNSKVMRLSSDKIIITRQDNGHWVYFSIRDDHDNGTIIDFLQNRGGGHLGEIRKMLRCWAGTPPPPFVSAYTQDLTPSRNRTGVLVDWERARVCHSLPYLTSRGIGKDVLEDPRFAGCVRVDKRNNALFPHYDHHGLCGFEMKNYDFTGFAAGGVKGLWTSRAGIKDHFLVFVESAIDAYSFHILHGLENTRYMSTGGGLNRSQPDFLRGAMEKMPAGSTVILGFDRDDAGEKLAEVVRGIVPSSCRVMRILPLSGTGKDWNEMLRYRLGKLKPGHRKENSTSPKEFFL